MLGDEIAAYLANAGLGLSLTSTSGGRIFAVPFPPDSPDSASCVIEYGGSANVDAFGPSLAAPVLQQIRFQVLARDHSNNQLACRSLAEQIYMHLRHFSGVLSGSTGGSVTYAFVKCIVPPFFLKFDENQRCIWAAGDFEALKSESLT